MSDPDITRAAAHWREVAGAVFVPHSERLVAVLDRLIDQVGEVGFHQVNAYGPPPLTGFLTSLLLRRSPVRNPR